MAEVSCLTKTASRKRRIAEIERGQKPLKESKQKTIKHWQAIITVIVSVAALWVSFMQWRIATETQLSPFRAAIFTEKLKSYQRVISEAQRLSSSVFISELGSKKSKAQTAIELKKFVVLLNNDAFLWPSDVAQQMEAYALQTEHIVMRWEGFIETSTVTAAGDTVLTIAKVRSDDNIKTATQRANDFLTTALALNRAMRIAVRSDELDTIPGQSSSRVFQPSQKTEAGPEFQNGETPRGRQPLPSK